jgi:hypothetical protein
MASIDDIELDRLAFGIRYDTHFRVEDRLGEIVDSVLATERQDVSRFPQIGYGAGTRQLSNEISSESLTFTRSDTIYDNRKASLHVADISKLANEFFDDVWGSVLSHAKPSPNRYGCLVGFSLPASWHPMAALLGEEERETSEFDFRFSKRLAVENALVKVNISDYQTVIFQVSCRGRRCRGAIDFQHYFEPALVSEKARKDNPFPRFAVQAADFFRGKGWDVLEQRLLQNSKAA